MKEAMGLEMEQLAAENQPANYFQVLLTYLLSCLLNTLTIYSSLLRGKSGGGQQCNVVPLQLVLCMKVLNVAPRLASGYSFSSAFLR